MKASDFKIDCDCSRNLAGKVHTIFIRATRPASGQTKREKNGILIGFENQNKIAFRTNSLWVSEFGEFKKKKSLFTFPEGLQRAKADRKWKIKTEN